MRRIEMMPGEPNVSMISSIINRVCPQCGGNMMDFECCGRCSRNWLSEWQWAFNVMKRPDALGTKGTGPKR